MSTNSVFSSARRVTILMTRNGKTPLAIRQIHKSQVRLVDKPSFDVFSKRKSEWRLPTLTQEQFGERGFLSQLLTGYTVLSIILFIGAHMLRPPRY